MLRKIWKRKPAMAIRPPLGALLRGAATDLGIFLTPLSAVRSSRPFEDGFHTLVAQRRWWCAAKRATAAGALFDPVRA
ncbi:hypothetical protein E5675_16185 [Sphingopyxis sp. PAMC25046]|uniref:hypothetical protein n=1 Tax=Sphingopyxis sp. PAMC25046 TaxID=2565556 RepID=UPI00109DE8A8|nr:hypothetical protein [Sphingopyxis sp. PAMC25046]QCB55818.1 hypothetical protein E5675_16185 [Sphingopyxis sp. PAMC25046]